MIVTVGFTCHRKNNYSVGGEDLDYKSNITMQVILVISRLVGMNIWRLVDELIWKSCKLAKKYGVQGNCILTGFGRINAVTPYMHM